MWFARCKHQSGSTRSPENSKRSRQVLKPCVMRFRCKVSARNSFAAKEGWRISARSPRPPQRLSLFLPRNCSVVFASVFITPFRNRLLNIIYAVWQMTWIKEKFVWGVKHLSNTIYYTQWPIRSRVSSYSIILWLFGFSKITSYMGSIGSKYQICNDLKHMVWVSKSDFLEPESVRQSVCQSVTPPVWKYGSVQAEKSTQQALQ